MKVKACIIDTETTGFKPPIVPIQLVYMPLKQELNKIMPWKAESYEEFFKPDKPIEYGAMAAHGLRHRDLENFDPWGKYKFPIQPEYFIGHNVDYDVDNIRSSLPKAFEAKSICTMALAQLAFPEVDSYKLVALAYFIQDHGFLASEYDVGTGVGHLWENYIDGAHGAEADVHMTAGLLLAVAGRLKVDTWATLYELSQLARTPIIMPFGKWKGTEIRSIEPSYRKWLAGQPDVDRNLLRALTMTRDSWDLHIAQVEGIRKCAS